MTLTRSAWSEDNGIKTEAGETMKELHQFGDGYSSNETREEAVKEIPVCVKHAQQAFMSVSTQHRRHRACRIVGVPRSVCRAS